MTAPMATRACHVAIEVREPSQVGELRRAAVRLAQALGFDEVAAGRVAIVATELGNNLVRHAQGGRVLIGEVEAVDGPPALELLSLDAGPGILDVAASLVDGHSTGGTPGTGLGAVRRLSSEFDLYSSRPGGTVVMARLTAATAPGTGAVVPHVPQGRYSVAALRLAAPGETVCGDNWALRRQGEALQILMADGLGHGPQACEAADAAAREFLAAAPGTPPSRVLDGVHQALRSTRGAAVAVATVDDEAGTVTFCGAGNIAGRIISGVGDRTLLSQHGTAGVQVRRLQDVVYDWPAHALVLLHSDGIVSRWNLDGARGLLRHHPGIIAGWLLKDHLRGRDDASVVVLKRRPT